MIWTSGGLNKLEIYRKLDVREVWIWKAGNVQVHALRGDRYVAVERSELLPALDLEQLLAFVDVKPMTRAVTQFARRSGWRGRAQSNARLTDG